MKPDPRRYVAHVRRCLTCSAARRRALMPRVRELVDRHLQETPHASYEDLVTAFGSPQSFALVVLDSVDPAEVTAAQKRRKYLPLGLLAALAVALAFLTLFWYQKYIISTDLNKNVTVIIGEAVPMTQEEYQEFWNQTEGSEETP